MLVALHVAASQCTTAATQATGALDTLALQVLKLQSTSSVVARSGAFPELARVALPPREHLQRWSAAFAFDASVLSKRLLLSEQLARAEKELLVEQVAALATHRPELALKLHVVRSLQGMIEAAADAPEYSRLVAEQVVVPHLGKQMLRAVTLELLLSMSTGAQPKLSGVAAAVLVESGEEKGLCSLVAPLSDQECAIRQQGLRAVQQVYLAATAQLLQRGAGTEAFSVEELVESVKLLMGAVGERLTDSYKEVRLLACNVLQTLLQSILPHKELLAGPCAAGAMLEGDEGPASGTRLHPCIPRELVKVVQHNLGDIDAEFVTANSTIANLLAQLDEVQG